MTIYPQVLRNRPRMVAAFVAGLLCAVLLPFPLRPTVRALIGWDCAVWLYLALMWVRMVTAHHDQVRDIAIREDENATTVLTIVSLATVASVAAIAIELATVKSVGFRAGLSHYAITGATLFGAWFMIPTIFTLHYARLYYGSPGNDRASFPGPEPGARLLGFPVFRVHDRGRVADGRRVDDEPLRAALGTRAVDPVVLLQHGRARAVDQRRGGPAELMQARVIRSVT